ncbi:hypothetical protein ACT43K_13370 [Acinetobacter baumannii]
MSNLSTEGISTIKFVFITLLFGFCGGCLGFFFLSWYYKNFSRAVPAPADAVAIANTYIVYTTFIFTGLAIFLAIATYYFSVQQAKSRKHLEHELLEKLLAQCKKDKKIGLELITQLIENQKAIQRFEELHGDKIREVVESYMEQYISVMKNQQHNGVSIPDRIENLRDKVKKPESLRDSNPPNVTQSEGLWKKLKKVVSNK